MKLVLFDLDGTLVSTGGAGVRALDRAFEALHGIRRAMEGISAAGKTDPLIIRDIFRRKLERDALDDEVRSAGEKYISFLAEEVPRSPRYRIMEGVKSVVEKFQEMENVLLALGTGNFERGARIKLEPAGLNSFFEFGGFGSDAEARPDVLRAAVRRGEEKIGRRFEGKDVVVIGDTILDVQAGKAVGAFTVAVACGHGKPDDLRAAGPDLFMENFTEAAALFDALS